MGTVHTLKPNKPLAMLAVNDLEVQRLREGMRALAAITVECIKGAPDEDTRLEYAARYSEALDLDARLEALGL